MTSLRLASLRATAQELEKQLLERIHGVKAVVTTPNGIVFGFDRGLFRQENEKTARLADWSDGELLHFSTHASLLVREVGE